MTDSSSHKNQSNRRFVSLRAQSYSLLGNAYANEN